MRLLDVFGDGRYRVNLDQVRLVKVQDFGKRKKAEVTFVYADDHESIFGVSSERLTVLEDILEELKGVPA